MCAWVGGRGQVCPGACERMNTACFHRTRSGVSQCDGGRGPDGCTYRLRESRWEPDASGRYSEERSTNLELPVLKSWAAAFRARFTALFRARLTPCCCRSRACSIISRSSPVPSPPSLLCLLDVVGRGPAAREAERDDDGVANVPAAPRRCPEPCSSLSLNSEPVACALLKLMLLPVPRLPGARRPWGTPLLPTDAIPSSDESVMSTSGVATAGLRDGSAAPARLDERRCIAQPGERAPLISVEHAPALGPQRHRGACGAPQPPTRGHRARRLPLLQADYDQTDHGRCLTGEACRSAQRPRADNIP